MKSITINFWCDKGHTQELRVDHKLGIEYAEGLAGLMDGTSPMYVHSPIGTDSVIGKCGYPGCGAQVHSTVEVKDESHPGRKIDPPPHGGPDSH